MPGIPPLPLAATLSLLNWLSPELRQLERERALAEEELTALGVPVVGQTVAEFGYQSPFSPVPALSPAWLRVDLGASRAIDYVALVPAQSDWQRPDRRAHGFPVRFRVDISDDAEFRQFVPLLNSTEADFPNPGVAPVTIAAGGRVARYVRVTVTKMPTDGDFYFYALAELMVLSDNFNVALHAPVQASAMVDSLRWNPQNLVDGRTPLGPPIRHERGERDGFYVQPEPGVAPVIELDLGEVLPLQEVRLHPVHTWRVISAPGHAFPIGLRVEAAKSADYSDRVILLDRKNLPNPGNNPVGLVAAIEARYVRVTATHATKGLLALSEIEVFSGGRNVAPEATIHATPDRSGRPERWPESLLVDGYTSFGRLISLTEWLRGWERRRELQLTLARIAEREPLLLAQAHRRTTGLALGAALVGLAGFAFYVARARRRRERELTELRARLARDLHDEIGSNLASITLLSEIAQEEEGSLHTSGTREDWSQIHRIARETTGAMHEVLWLIGGREEVGADLEARLKLVASRMLPRHQVRWKTALAPLPADWPGESRRQVFLFFKEALANIVRHSRAAQVDLSAQVAEGKLTLEVADDGVGFDLQRPSAGIGLPSLRKRARALGGNVAIESAPAAGTRVRLEVPLVAPRRPPFVRRVLGRN